MIPAHIGSLISTTYLTYLLIHQLLPINKTKNRLWTIWRTFPGIRLTDKLHSEYIVVAELSGPADDCSAVMHLLLPIYIQVAEIQIVVQTEHSGF